jgi:hypothetical protein
VALSGGKSVLFVNAKAVLIRFLRKSWWWIVLILSSVILGAAGVMFLGRRKQDVIDGDEGSHFPERLGRARRERLRAELELERVRLEAEVERARAQSVAGAEQARIDEIEQIGETDPAAARRALASWLSNNL